MVVPVEGRGHDVGRGPEEPAPGRQEGGVGAQPELLEPVVAHAGEHPALQESAERQSGMMIQGCQMAIARFLNLMCLALRAS